jgi:hypothetical protein
MARKGGDGKKLSRKKKQKTFTPSFSLLTGPRVLGDVVGHVRVVGDDEGNREQLGVRDDGVDHAA